MYFYLLIESDYNDDYEDGVISEFQHIYHNEKYSNEEFFIMCDQAIRTIKERDKDNFIYNNKLANELHDMFGFQRIKHIASYEFEI